MLRALAYGFVFIGLVACGGRARIDQAGLAGDAVGDAEAGVSPLNAPRPRLACGASTSCFLTDAGSVRCWGSSFLGELGNGGVDGIAMAPATVLEPRDFVGLGGGDFQGCAFDAQDQALCWGALPSLAPPTAPTISAPTLLPLASIANLAFGGVYHACATTRAGAVYCLGPDDFLGNGSGPSDSPIAVAGIHGAVDVAVGGGQANLATLVVLADGSVLGWGRQYAPALTSNPDSDQLTPVLMPGLANVRQVTIGAMHACALLADGHVTCWGSNSDVQLGVPDSTPPYAPPQIIAGLDAVAEVRAGDFFTCARRTNGEMRCWGENAFGELAQPQIKSWSEQPLAIAVPLVSEMAVGQAHVCVRAVDGTVLCWGDNYAAQVSLTIAENIVRTPVVVTP